MNGENMEGSGGNRVCRLCSGGSAGDDGDGSGCEMSCRDWGEGDRAGLANLSDGWRKL